MILLTNKTFWVKVILALTAFLTEHCGYCVSNIALLFLRVLPICFAVLCHYAFYRVP